VHDVVYVSPVEMFMEEGRVVVVVDVVVVGDETGGGFGLTVYV
jgi:hypothetical protein